MADTKAEELDESIDNIIEYWDFSPAQDEDSRIERVRNEIKSLIAKDRTDLLDELEKQIDDAPSIEHKGGTFIHWNEVTAVIEAARKRIGEEKR